MQTNRKSLTFVEMWYKVNQLSRENLTQHQIALKLGVDRSTVRRYQRMTEDDFNSMLQREAGRHACKLDRYREFIVKQLQDYPFLSSPQILDHLKEHFEDFGSVSDKTVYNYVMRVREEEGIPKSSEQVRQMHKIPDCEYGEQAQVDYGEKWVMSDSGRRVKVHFFAMTLCRSRYKFIYFQDTPFTALTTVYAHHLAFKFFGGMPKQVLYDQDRKLLTEENYGDYIQTAEMARFIKEAGFEPVFMMSADPQSKGKVENVVRYVKHNFLPGRPYHNITLLNEEAIGWLARTANGKRHSTTQLIPAEEFQKEREHLLPYTLEMEAPQADARPYTVRQDNTILYHSNFYDMPLGTYEGKGTKVLLVRDAETDELKFYKQDGVTLVISHHECREATGQHITLSGHRSTKGRDIREAEQTLCDHLGQEPKDSPLSSLLSAINEDRPRYYRKVVMDMASLLTGYSRQEAVALVDVFLKKKVYNPSVMKQIAEGKYNRTKMPEPKVTITAQMWDIVELEPARRSISDYDAIIGEGVRHE